MRYYDPRTANEMQLHDDDDVPEHAIPMDDPRVTDFFQILPEGKKVKIDDMGLPHIIDESPMDPNIERNAKNLQYLIDTDYYAIRKAETGQAMPEGIQESRQHARDNIVD